MYALGYEFKELKCLLRIEVFTSEHSSIYTCTQNDLYATSYITAVLSYSTENSEAGAVIAVQERPLLPDADKDAEVEI